MRLISKVSACIAIPLLLASCGSPHTPTGSSTSTGLSSTTSSLTSTSSMVTTTKDVVAKGNTISVDYTGRLEDGTIFDSSRVDDAKKSTNYSSGRTYEPLSFTVGAGEMIKGFDQGVVGMHLGEKKTITVSPEDGYGPATKETTVPKNEFEDTFTDTLSIDNFRDKIVRTVPKDKVPNADSFQVGQVINSGTQSAKITAIDESGITLEMDNPDHPFKGKDLAVGLSEDYQGNTVTINALTDTGVTVTVDNKTNPFFGQTLKVGLSAPIPNGSGSGAITIDAITDTGVTIAVPNPSPLAGKTLIFDVEIKSIKSSTDATPTDMNTVTPTSPTPVPSTDSTVNNNTEATTSSTGNTTGTSSTLPATVSGTTNSGSTN